MIGRVNTTFTLVIFVGIFVTQIAIGWVLGRWTSNGGHYPVIAHQVVWAGLVVAQVLGAVWYFAPQRRVRVEGYAVEGR
jgi:hypothetical protein